MVLTYTEAIKKFNNFQNVAVCISGKKDKWEETLYNLMLFTKIDNVNVDFFVHLDEDESKETHRIKNLLEPKIMVCSKINKILFLENDQSITKEDDLKSIQSFSIVSESLKEYQIRNDFFYDVVIKSQFNVQLNENLFDSTKRIKRNTIYGINYENKIIKNDINSKTEGFKIDDEFWYSDGVTYNFLSNFGNSHYKIKTKSISNDVDKKFTWFHFIKKNNIDLQIIEKNVTYL